MEQITSVGMAGFANKHFVQPFFSKERPMFSIGADTFLGFVNEALAAETNLCRWVDSQQMPFCKYLFVPNFTSACPSHLKIENSHAQWLRSG